MSGNWRPFLKMCKIFGFHPYTSCDHNLKLSKFPIAWTVQLIVAILINTYSTWTFVQFYSKEKFIFLAISEVFSFFSILTFGAIMLQYRHLQDALKAAYEFDRMTNTSDDKRINPIFEWFGIIFCTLTNWLWNYFMEIVYKQRTDYYIVAWEMFKNYCNLLQIVRVGVLLNIFARRFARLNQLVINEAANTSAKPLTIFDVYKCYKCLIHGVGAMNTYYLLQLSLLIMMITIDSITRLFLLNVTDQSNMLRFLQFMELFGLQGLTITTIYHPGHQIYVESKKLGCILFSGWPPPVADRTPIMELNQFGIYLYANPACIMLGGLAIVNNELFTTVIEFIASNIVVLLAMQYDYKE